MRELSIQKCISSVINATDRRSMPHSSTKLEPIIKWAGGKGRELKYIIPNIPKSFDTFIEPFVGGGSVFTATNATAYRINDKSKELINFYRSLHNNEKENFFSSINEILFGWNFISTIIDKNSNTIILKYKLFRTKDITLPQLINFIKSLVNDNSKVFNTMLSHNFIYYDNLLIEELKKCIQSKLIRISKVEKENRELPNDDIIANVECAIKGGYYTYIRKIYNNKLKYIKSDGSEAAIFFFIRNFAYSGMFRNNAQGEFNVPYGGIGYNRKNIQKKLDYYKSLYLTKLFEKTEISCLDFEEFLETFPPNENDFIFLDPPYDTEFSTYSQNKFDRDDQIRLSEYLINKCKAKWMLIIKNTDFIINLYDKKGLDISIFDKTYLVSFMNRNDKKCEHLVIKNY